MENHIDLAVSEILCYRQKIVLLYIKGYLLKCMNFGKVDFAKHRLINLLTSQSETFAILKAFLLSTIFLSRRINDVQAFYSIFFLFGVPKLNICFSHQHCDSWTNYILLFREALYLLNILQCFS